MSRLGDLEARIAALAGDFRGGLVARGAVLARSRAALVEGDPNARAAIAAEAHKLRGTGTSFGYADLSTLAARVEDGAPTASTDALLSSLDALLAAVAVIADAAPTSHAARPSPRSVDARKPAEPVAAGSSAPSSRYRALVLDDDEGTRRLLSVCLRPASGFDTVVVATWAQAFERLGAERFDLLVTDWMMPDGDGLAFIRALRASGGANADVPVVVLSAAARREPPAGEAGPADWIQKPFAPRALVEKLLGVASKR